jgi:hypothetical protein
VTDVAGYDHSSKPCGGSNPNSRNAAAAAPRHFLAVADDAIDPANSIEMHAGAVAEGEAAFVWHVVAAAGTPKRIGTGAVSAVPFEYHFAEGETLGISPRMAAVKFAVSGSLLKEISPVSRLCGTGAFSRSGSSVIVAFRQRSHNLGLVRREKSHERLGTPWSLDQELVADRLYSKTRIVRAAQERHSVHASSSSCSMSPRPSGIGVIGGGPSAEASRRAWF